MYADQKVGLRCALCAGPVPNVTPRDVWTQCPHCEAMVFRAGLGPRVVVVHESERMSLHIGTILLGEGFSPVHAGVGPEALLLAREAAGVVLDVGLSQPNAFLVIDSLRSDSAYGNIKIILVASVFNKTAYKRKPETLYGADDYVEQHHIPDLLPVKLGRLLNVKVEGAMTPAMRDTVERIEQAHRRLELRGPARVRALARAIVADVALYHEAQVTLARETQSSEPLRQALAEARRILAELAHDADYPNQDPIEEAFTTFLRSMGAPPA